MSFPVYWSYSSFILLGPSSHSLFTDLTDRSLLFDHRLIPCTGLTAFIALEPSSHSLFTGLTDRSFFLDHRLISCLLVFTDRSLFMDHRFIPCLLSGKMQ